MRRFLNFVSQDGPPDLIPGYSDASITLDDPASLAVSPHPPHASWPTSPEENCANRHAGDAESQPPPLQLQPEKQQQCPPEPETNHDAQGEDCTVRPVSNAMPATPHYGTFDGTPESEPNGMPEKLHSPTNDHVTVSRLDRVEHPEHATTYPDADVGGTNLSHDDAKLEASNFRPLSAPVNQSPTTVVPIPGVEESVISTEDKPVPSTDGAPAITSKITSPPEIDFDVNVDLDVATTFPFANQPDQLVAPQTITIAPQTITIAPPNVTSPPTELTEPASSSPLSAAPQVSHPPSELQLRNIVEVLSEFALRADRVENRGDGDNEKKKPDAVPRATRAAVVNALRELAEIMVWADQHLHPLWDVFMECALMPLLYRCLHASVISESDIPSDHPPPASPQHTLNGPVFADDTGTQLIAAYDADVLSSNGEHPNNPNLPSKSLDTAPLLPSEGSTSPSPQDRSQEVSEIEAVTAINDTSLQEIAVIVPRPSLSVPTRSPPEDSRSSLYNTFSLSRSSPADPVTNGAVLGEEVLSRNDDSLSLAVEVQSQILQTLSIIVQSVSRKQSLFCLFSSNHINDILSFSFSFDSEEMLGLLMSAVKTISLKLDKSLLQLFFNPSTSSFPLYSVVARFYNHPDSMVRIAVRNVTLTLCALGDDDLHEYIARDDTKYLENSVALLAKLCGRAARAFELLMDDGREVGRTRTRTGIFRRRVRIVDVEDKLQEIENICAYFGDIASLSESRVCPAVMNMLGTEVFAPLFRPLASYACPRAMHLMRRRRWSLSTGDGPVGQEAALPMFDAAARMLLLAFLLSCSRTTAVVHALVAELARPSILFDNRHVFHALKAVCADVTGTERLTFLALLVIEVLLNGEGMTSDMMQTLGYSFEEELEIDEDGIDEVADAFDDVMPVPNSGEERRESRDVPMVMTLKDFDTSGTPMSSKPSTPLPMFGMSPGPPGVSSSIASPISFLRTLSSSTSLDDAVSILDVGSGVAATRRAAMETGTVSLREVIMSVVTVVRRREVRTRRVMRAVGTVLMAVGDREGGQREGIWQEVADVAKTVCDELAVTVRRFVKSRNTTIVSIEAAFEHLQLVAEVTPCEGDVGTAAGAGVGGGSDDVSERFGDGEVARVTVAGVVKLASEVPRGAGKRRRAGVDGVVAPVEVEDAEALFAMMGWYERALDISKRMGDGGGRKKGIRVTEVVKASLEECELEDSYLDKRDALESVADAIIRHGDIA